MFQSDVTAFALDVGDNRGEALRPWTNGRIKLKQVALPTQWRPELIYAHGIRCHDEVQAVHGVRTSFPRQPYRSSVRPIACFVNDK